MHNKSPFAFIILFFIVFAIFRGVSPWAFFGLLFLLPWLFSSCNIGRNDMDFFGSQRKPHDHDYTPEKPKRDTFYTDDGDEFIVVDDPKGTWQV